MVFSKPEAKPIQFYMGLKKQNKNLKYLFDF